MCVLLTIETILLSPAAKSSIESSNAKEAAKSGVHSDLETSEKEEDQQALQKSEEMMRAFLKATGGEEEDSSKSERTRTIIKTIKVFCLVTSFTMQ